MNLKINDCWKELIKAKENVTVGIKMTIGKKMTVGKIKKKILIKCQGICDRWNHG